MKDYKELFEALLAGKKISCDEWISNAYVEMKGGFFYDDEEELQQDISCLDFKIEYYHIYSEYCYNWSDVVDGFRNGDFELVESPSGVRLDNDFKSNKDLTLSCLRALMWKAL